MLVCVEDITDRQRAEEQVQANLRIQRAIAAILRASLEPDSLEKILQRVLELLVSLPWIRLESKGAVFLWEPESEMLLMAAQIGIPEKTLSTCRQVKSGTCLCGRAAATRQIVFAGSVDGRHSIRYPGMMDHAHYCVPIVSEGQVYGVLTLYLAEGHSRHPEEEVFLSAVGDVLATTIQRRRALQSLEENEGQLRIAQRIQRHLLPASPPAIPGFDIAGALYAAEYAAGDHFDYLNMSDEGLGVVVGDVSGHGFATALLMASVCARLRSFSEIGMGIGEIASRLNTALSRETEDEPRLSSNRRGYFARGRLRSG